VLRPKTRTRSAAPATRSAFLFVRAPRGPVDNNRRAAASSSHANPFEYTSCPRQQHRRIVRYTTNAHDFRITRAKLSGHGRGERRFVCRARVSRYIDTTRVPSYLLYNGGPVLIGTERGTLINNYSVCARYGRIMRSHGAYTGLLYKPLLSVYGV